MANLSPRLPSTPEPSLRTLAQVLAFVALYAALAWISFIHPMVGLNITPWNPQSALAVALLMWRPRAWWVVWLAAACGEAVVPLDPVSWGAVIASSGALTLAYWAIAAALARWAGGTAAIGTRRRLVLFMGIVAIGALAGAVLHVFALWAVGIVPVDRLTAAIHRGAIGDGVGLLVTLPLLLVLGDRERRAGSRGLLRSSESWLIALLTVAGIFAVFTQTPAEQFKFFYLLFLPVVWGAARFGVTGAIWSATIVQLLMVVAVQSETYRPITVFELQLLMAAVAATGLLLGATVDEREEADRALRASLRLAAAGDMAAALAHELNQPLTAMTTYARACQLLAARLATERPQETAQLVDATGKLADEATRAAEVVKRLRNFFRDRVTQLQPVPVPQLLDDAVRTQATRAQSLGVQLDVSCEVPDAVLWLDAVQVGVVLRNLIANALDAAATGRSPGEARSWATVRATREGGDVVVEVADSAVGLQGDEATAVFERRSSAKPGGMGVGLAISRSIVEAHGGRLWAEPGPGGRFYFSLPLDGMTPPGHD